MRSDVRLFERGFDLALFSLGEALLSDVLGFRRLMTSGSILIPVLEQYSFKDLVDLRINEMVKISN